MLRAKASRLQAAAEAAKAARTLPGSGGGNQNHVQDDDDVNVQISNGKRKRSPPVAAAGLNKHVKKAKHPRLADTINHLKIVAPAKKAPPRSKKKGKVGISISSLAPTKTVPSVRPKPRTTSSLPLGCGANVEEIIRVGQYQMMCDECLHLCRTTDEMAQPNEARGSSSQARTAPGGTHYDTQQSLREVLGWCLYFVALDCTLPTELADPLLSDNESLQKTAAQSALRIRQAILKSNSGACLRGIVNLVVLDPWTRQWRGKVPTAVTEAATQNVTNTSNSLMDSSQSADDDSFMQESSQSLSGSVDPTMVGRRRIRERQQEQAAQVSVLDTISELEYEGDSPEQSKDKDAIDVPKRSRLSKQAEIDLLSECATAAASAITDNGGLACDQQDQLTLCVLKSLKATGARAVVEAAQRYCCESTADANSYVLADANSYILTSYVPLVALRCIITGKCKESDTSCIECIHGDDEYTPILETNRLLGESNAIPLLSQALAEALTAVTHQLERETGSSKGPESLKFTACLAALQERVAMLVTLIDGASFLCESNRKLFCEEGFTSEAGGCLLVVAVVVLNKLLASAPSALFVGIWGEVTLSVLCLLTSLTHESMTAQHAKDAHCGLQVLSHVLFKAVHMTKPLADSELINASTNYCLTIIANVIECGGSCRTLCEMVKPQWNAQENNDELFLTWLTQWMVEGMQDALGEMSDGEHKLDEQKREHLSTAGYGFVLLSYLLVNEEDVDVDKNNTTAYQIILEELPGHDHDAKLAYLKNALKAFRYLFRCSMDDVSVAIVDKVTSLIQRIESIPDKRQRLLLECTPNGGSDDDCITDRDDDYIGNSHDSFDPIEQQCVGCNLWFSATVPACPSCEKDPISNAPTNGNGSETQGMTALFGAPPLGIMTAVGVLTAAQNISTATGNVSTAAQNASTAFESVSTAAQNVSTTAMNGPIDDTGDRDDVTKEDATINWARKQKTKRGYKRMNKHHNLHHGATKLTGITKLKKGRGFMAQAVVDGKRGHFLIHRDQATVEAAYKIGMKRFEEHKSSTWKEVRKFVKEELSLV
jgi:hypothetical protein